MIAGLSIISMPPGMIPAPIMAATQSRALTGRKTDQQRSRPSTGFAGMRTVTSVITPSRPSIRLRSPSDRNHRNPGIFPPGAPLPIDQHHLREPQVVCRQRILDNAPRRVFSDITADGTRDLARRVGRVVETVSCNRCRDREVGDAWLRGHAALSPSISRMRLNLPRPSVIPSSSGNAPPDSDMPAPRVRSLYLRHGGMLEFRHLRRRLRQDDNHRQLPVRCQPIAFIRRNSSSSAMTPSPGTMLRNAAMISVRRDRTILSDRA